MLVRFFLLILAIGGSCHKCSYQVPTVDEVVLGVPLELDDIGSRSRRDTFQPLRIRLFFDESIANLTVEKQLFINSSLVPEAVGYWSQALMVRRSSAPIRLSRKCLTSHYYIRQGEKQQACATGCKDVTTCGETPVPDSHLYQCRYCESSNPLTCSVSGPADGPGVGDTDFLLYVSAVASDRCQNPDTVAYAAHCQQEADFDR
uniref:Leishmanolysin-like peptidase n=1 Tax=Plectus sambesii TaxID=2011161 RepID=A0A914XEW1_9BILA